VKLPNKKYFCLAVEFEILHLQELMTAIENYLEGIKKDAINKAEITDHKLFSFKNDYYTFIDSLENEVMQIKEMEDIYKKIMVIGLYMIIERYIKKIMKLLYQDLDEALKTKKLYKLYKWELVNKEIMDNCNFKLSDVVEFISISEIRCLNNVIKHSGIVDKYLAAFPVWAKELGNEVDADLIDFERYYASIPKFISDFIEKIYETQKQPS
jgi:hypothetical protein